jgi:hypothetical protein
LFPTTLKDKALRWFMTLGTNSIRTWDDMKRVFLEKYKDYCIHHDLRNEVFKMNQKEDESLEDLVERFTYNIKRSKLHNLGSDTLKTLLLNAIRMNGLIFLTWWEKEMSLNCHFKRFVNCARTYQEEKQSMEDPLKIQLWKE